MLRLDGQAVQLSIVWVAWLCLALVNAESVFEYRFSAIVVLFLVLATLLGLLVQDQQIGEAPRGVSLVALWVAATAGLTTPTLLYVTGNGRLVLAFLPLFAVSAITLVMTNRHSHLVILLVAISVVLLTGVAVAVGDPEPRFDVWHFSQQATSDFIHGRSIYGHSWNYPDGVPRDRWITGGFPYGPITVVLLAPGYLLGDVRIAVLAFAVLGVVLLGRLGRRGTAPLIGLALALTPAGYALVRSSWTEPLLFVDLCLVCWSLRSKRPIWAVLALAVGLATKQHLLVILPVLAASRQMGVRRTAVAVAAAGALVAPWFLLSPRTFVHDTLLLHVHLPARADARDIYALGLRIGWMPPGWLMIGCLLLVEVLVCLSVRRRGDLGSLALGVATVLLAANLVNKQAFFNQYWLVGSMLLLALALWSEDAAVREPPEQAQVAMGRGEPDRETAEVTT